jgi:hypothetical protein
VARAAGEGDPFGALAQFVSVYPQVQQDIETYVAPVDPSKIDPASQGFIDADVALSAFTQLAEAVTGALSTGFAERLSAELPVESYELSIVESMVELDSLRHAGTKIQALLVNVNDVPDALASPVLVGIDGCTAQAPPTAAAGDSSSSYSYVFRDGTTGDWLTALDGETIGPRTVTLPGLNVLARQDAWTSAWVGRNESAAEPFRYQTQPVYFASPQYPTNRYTTPPIEVAAIGDTTPQLRTPQDHLAALFAALFAKAPAGEQTLLLECRYAYDLSGAGLGQIELPIYLLPPTQADPAVDLVIPTGGCPVDPTQGPLVCRLGKAIHGWWTAAQPSTSGGVFLLRLTVLSQLTGQPLIVLDGLQLTESWIDWS